MIELFYSIIISNFTSKPNPGLAVSNSTEETNQTRRKNWSVTSKASIREQRLARLLVIIAFSFVILTLPANIAFMWYTFTNINTTNEESMSSLFIITNFLESINYSINFYIYIYVHDEIRLSFLDLCKAVFTCSFASSQQISDHASTVS